MVSLLRKAPVLTKEISDSLNPLVFFGRNKYDFGISFLKLIISISFIGFVTNYYKRFQRKLILNFSSSTFNFKPETLNSELSKEKRACSIFFECFFDTNTYDIFRFSNSAVSMNRKPIPPMTNSFYGVTRCSCNFETMARSSSIKRSIG
jgi:hypothetical protein